MKRWVAGAIAIAMLLLVVAGIESLSRRDRVMHEEEARSGRLVTYALAPGESLRLPVEPGAEVIRVVVHAFRRGALAPTPHLVTWRISGNSALEVIAPGTTRRVRSESSDTSVGDPVPFNVDLTGHPSELVLTLQGVAEADGVLVRAYVRDTLLASEARMRRVELGQRRREHIATRAGEVGWVDLTEPERKTLLGAPWRKLAPLPTEGQPLRSVVIDLRDPSPAEPSPFHEAGTAALLARETLAGVVIGPNRLLVRSGNPQALLSLGTSGAQGTRTLTGSGELQLELPRGSTLAFEATLEKAGQLTVLALETQRVHLASAVSYNRLTPERAAVIDAGETPMVLRVRVRKPLSSSELASPTSLGVIAVVTRGTESTTSHFETNARATRQDHYDADGRTPSESSSFFVLIPSGGRATLRPELGETDVELAELDSNGTTERFVQRRPSNWRTLGEAGSLHVAWRPATERTRLAVSRETLHVRRPVDVAVSFHGARSFVPGATHFPIEIPPGRSGKLRVRLLSDRPVDVTVRIDGEVPRRRRGGLATSITTTRHVHVEGEAKLVVWLGDDLEPGRHVLTFERSQPSANLAVHLPWAKRARALVASAWLSGDFDQ